MNITPRRKAVASRMAVPHLADMVRRAAVTDRKVAAHRAVIPAAR